MGLGNHVAGVLARNSDYLNLGRSPLYHTFGGRTYVLGGGGDFTMGCGGGGRGDFFIFRQKLKIRKSEKTDF